VLTRPDRYPAGELQDYALSHFSWHDVARRTVDLYMEATSAEEGVR
jgi:hypothetical protein